MGTILPRPLSQLTDMELGECEETTLHDVTGYPSVESNIFGEETLVQRNRVEADNGSGFQPMK